MECDANWRLARPPMAHPTSERGARWARCSGESDVRTIAAHAGVCVCVACVFRVRAATVKSGVDHQSNNDLPREGSNRYEWIASTTSKSCGCRSAGALWARLSLLQCCWGRRSTCVPQTWLKKQAVASRSKAPSRNECPWRPLRCWSWLPKTLPKLPRAKHGYGEACLPIWAPWLRPQRGP